MDAWSFLRLLETEPAARAFLYKHYHNKGIEHAERLAFQQSTRFLYTWKQARLFYESAQKVPLSIKPLLLFYGCVHVLKGWLVVIDPDYPQNSRVLQHGVTTRKVKRNSYQFLKDEVRPQKEGLFSHLAHLLSVSPLQDRYGIQELMTYLVAMREPLLAVTGNASPWTPVAWTTQTDTETNTVLHCLHFPSRSGGALAYSPETFQQYVKRFTHSPDILDSVHWSNDENKTMVVPSSSFSLLGEHPLFCFQEQSLFFWNSDNDTLPLPEWANHYLLLYVLSMLSRYDTEWWGELTLSHSYAEQYLIDFFLEHHANVFPTVIMRQMQKNNTFALK
ncbi:YaaC family protein [Brevibacillus borstelensis]|uniref:YaaC family protein n=1 Tax=Brevibacillus borstelensis TaxID=45462 RepID=UPI0030BF487A